MLQTKTALVLINEHSRRGRESASRVIEELTGYGIKIIKDKSESSEDLIKLIHKHRHEIDLVVVGGGDGTMNAVVDTLVETKLPLGIIPLGTANDLARTLQIPINVAEACKIIATGNLYPIDLGCVNGKHFFNVASLGLSVKITQKLTKDLKRRWGVLAYAATALQVIAESKPIRAEIISGENNFKVKTIQIAVGNGRYYGGGLSVSHDATIDDERLDLYSLEIKRWWQILSLPWAILAGKHQEVSGSRYLSGEEFEIRTRTPHPINTDGEITTATPAKFKVIKGAINVVLLQKPNNNL